MSISMATGDNRRSDQTAIWDEIASKSERLATASPTQAMNAMYDSEAIPLNAYQDAFAWAERQAGVMFASIGAEPGLGSSKRHPGRAMDLRLQCRHTAVNDQFGAQYESGFG